LDKAITVTRVNDSSKEELAIWGVEATPPTGNLIPAPASTGRDFLRQTVIGIHVIADLSGKPEQIIGILTDMTAQPISDPVRRTLDAPHEDGIQNQFIAVIDKLRDSVNRDQVLVGLGLTVSGEVNDGRVVYSSIGQWEPFSLSSSLADNMQLPVIVENDANALAIYEHRFGDIADDSFAVINITDIGIGCGLIIGNQSYHGIQGMAGEIGHMAFSNHDSVRCHCSSTGCLESIATPMAIERTLHDFGYSSGFSAALNDSDEDRVAHAFQSAGAELGQGIANMINLLGLSTVVIYGPPNLLGNPRNARMADDSALGENKTAQYFVEAMVYRVRRQALSPGQSDCQLIIRPQSWQTTACAAAASLIDKIIPPISSRHDEGEAVVVKASGREVFGIGRLNAVSSTATEQSASPPSS
jgi:predicted NBD/HSP70 family sugar kinase